MLAFGKKENENENEEYYILLPVLLVVVIHFTVLWSKKYEKREYEKKENENENEEYYILLPVLFDENFALALKLVCAAAGVERSGSRLACILACDSSETGFLLVVHGGHSFSVLRL